MATFGECRLFHRALTIDDVSKKPNCNNVKFKRAFQFLQLLLIQRVYGIDITTRPILHNPLKCSQQEHDQEKDQQLQERQQNFEVFLGGSCNPTTWRRDQAIPYLQSRSVSYYNPQVANWTPDLVEIEHRAKELAPLLFFVIDHDTRALASIVEVCYLAARGRSIIVAMSPMPERNLTKFIQQKNNADEKDNEDDYENVSEARRTLRTLLRSISVPVFEDVRLALECTAYILETTKRTISHQNPLNEAEIDDADVLTPLPTSPSTSNLARSAPVVLIRSLSNKTAYESTDEFYQQMRQTEEAKESSSKFYQERLSSTPESSKDRSEFPQTPDTTKTQLSCSTNESDDDGYGSLSSSSQGLSTSVSSLNELFESTIELQREENSLGSNTRSATSIINNLLTSFYAYIPLVKSTNQSDSTTSQSLLVLLTLPFRFLKNTLISPRLSLPVKNRFFPSQESVTSGLPSPTSSQLSTYMFDIYIAAGEHDEYWLNVFALPSLEKNNITFIKRQFYPDNEQIDPLYDVHLRKRSRILYYLINGSERLSHLAAELAFLIGERKHQIVIYLQTKVDDSIENISSQCERRDIQRSRTYLEDLATKENITLCHTRQQSWQKVLEIFHQQD